MQTEPSSSLVSSMHTYKICGHAPVILTTFEYSKWDSLHIRLQCFDAVTRSTLPVQRSINNSTCINQPQPLTLPSKLSYYKDCHHATSSQLTLFLRAHTSFQPSQCTGVHLPYLQIGRRATFCIYRGKEAGEPGASLTC